jgi:hypothetical protein
VTVFYFGNIPNDIPKITATVKANTAPTTIIAILTIVWINSSSFLAITNNVQKIFLSVKIHFLKYLPALSEVEG